MHSRSLPLPLTAASVMLASLAITACGAATPDERSLLARSWACEMTTAADGLSATLHEEVTFNPSGSYASAGRIEIRQGDQRGELLMAWTGTWALSGDTLTRKLDSFEPKSATVNGAPLPAARLAEAANAFRRDMVTEQAELVSIDAASLDLKTDSAPMSCKAS